MVATVNANIYFRVEIIMISTSAAFLLLSGFVMESFKKGFEGGQCGSLQGAPPTCEKQWCSLQGLSKF